MRSTLSKVWAGTCLIAVALLAVGCVTTTGTGTATAPTVSDKPVELTGMSNEELRAELESALRLGAHFHRTKPFDISNWKINWLEMGEDYVFIGFADASSLLPGVVWMTEHFQYSFRFEQLSETCNKDSCWLPGTMSIGFPESTFRSNSLRLDNAVYTVSLRAKRQHDEEQARFSQLVSQARGRAASAPPESLRRLIVQAEALRQDKDYVRAAATFRKLIRQDPVAYPAAHFNLALLYEMLGDYSGAIESMQRYLVLQPQAADARAAQDKIYAWEMKVTRR